MQVWSLGLEDPLEKNMATHSSILAWRIPWTEETGRLYSKGSQRGGHGWSNLARMHTFENTALKYYLDCWVFWHPLKFHTLGEELTCLPLVPPLAALWYWVPLARRNMGSSQRLPPELCHWFWCICPISKSSYKLRGIFYILKPWLINKVCALFCIYFWMRSRVLTAISDWSLD